MKTISSQIKMRSPIMVIGTKTPKITSALLKRLAAKQPVDPVDRIINIASQRVFRPGAL